MEIAIYGAGGFAREVAWLVNSCSKPQNTYKVVCFIDDIEHPPSTLINEVPVYNIRTVKKQFPNALVTIAVGSPAVRKKLVQVASEHGFKFATLIHPSVLLSEHNQIGNGTVICAGSIITTNVCIGNHVQINLSTTIGHDATINDYTTLSPGVHISGCVSLGKRVFVGTGAVIINGTPDKFIEIGDDVVIGAGACVTKSIPSGLTVVGVPARPV